MKLEESISNLEMYRANNSNYDEDLANDIDVVLEALENSIPKEVIEETIKKHKKEYEEILSEYGNIDTEVIINVPNKNVRKYLNDLMIKWTILEELLEGE